MSEITVSRLRENELAEFRDFCLAMWKGPHPLVHDEATFERYFRAADGGINFAVAREGESGGLLSVCGYILTNSSPSPDVWISFLLSKKGAPFGLAYKLFDFISETTRCRTLGCNNIREKTRGLYEFRGWSFGMLDHFYRLNSDKAEYTLCNISQRDLPPAPTSDMTTKIITDERGLEPFEKAVLPQNVPYKDRLYLKRRFLNCPWFDYEIVGLFDGDEPRALVVFRQIDAAGAAVLRVVDYIGHTRALPAAGAFLDGELRRRNADFCDWYAHGLDLADMRRAGFALRARESENIVPNYLEPPLMKNVDFFYFTSAPDGYRVFKADGDQDRPNLEL